MKSIFNISLVAGLLLASSLANAANVNFFNDRSQWELAAGTFSLEDFSDATLNTGLSITGDDVTINHGYLHDVVNLGSTPDTVFGFSASQTGFGGDWNTVINGRGTGIVLTLRLFNGTDEVLSQEISDSLNNNFFGFTSDVAFTSITFTEGTQIGSQETYTLDNLVYSPAVSVSEPSAFALLILSVFTMLFAARRRA